VRSIANVFHQLCWPPTSHLSAGASSTARRYPYSTMHLHMYDARGALRYFHSVVRSTAPVLRPDARLPLSLSHHRIYIPAVSLPLSLSLSHRRLPSSASSQPSICIPHTMSRGTAHACHIHTGRNGHETQSQPELDPAGNMSAQSLSHTHPITIYSASRGVVSW